MVVLMWAVLNVALTYVSRNMLRRILTILVELCVKKPKDFVVIQLEKVPEDTKLEDFRRRESSWIQRLDTLRRG